MAAASVMNAWLANTPHYVLHYPQVAPTTQPEAETVSTGSFARIVLRDLAHNRQCH
ncbi:hypothetical protein [Rhizobium rhizogenes]|uniref:hypothetical protein n=1 Tax=Rhizobium rhizogenes TaxID=359 RepID=UPI0015718874|nr:hypothetical protein [Rhizobium rhizogenes]NTF98214.1 hypothetical protein [Rhizobium rhizogenes]